MPKGDKYEERLAIAKQLNEKFLSIGNIVESHKARLSIAKSLIKIHEYKEALQIIDSSLSFSTANNYLFFEGQFSLWKGKCLSVTNGDSTEIENLFRDALNIGKKIESSKLTTDSLVTLAAYYQINDLDSKALEIAKDILMSPVGFKDEMLIGLKQQAGLSAFKLGYHEASLNYLMDAVNSSIQNGNEYLIATSKTFLGLVLGELNNFTDSDKVYYEAKTIASTIKEESSRLEVLSIILGYQAKTKMTAGDFQEAEKLYQQTLTIDKQLGVKSDLIFYQLNSGLAMALDKQGRKQEAEKYRVVALQYQTLMLTKHEKNNCLLSFLPSNCAK